MLPLNASTVTKYIEDKFALEQDLALMLWTVFDQPGYMRKLRQWALCALFQMMRSKSGLLRYVMNEEEKYLALYRYGRHPLDLVDAIARDSATPGDITDVARLWGRWVEAGAPTNTKDGLDRLKQKIPLRQAEQKIHDAMFAEKQSRRKGVQPGADEAEWVWEILRNRLDHHGTPLEIKGKVAEYLENENKRCHGIASGTAANITLVQGGVPVVTAGGKVYAGRLGKRPAQSGEKKSATGIIERVFGLLDLKNKSEGCDISGTTADFIQFVHFWQRSTGAGEDPYLFCVPLATIVAGYHHSLVEVALTLTFNSKINYVIGDYSSLIPRGNFPAGENYALTCIRANKDRRNRKFVVYYDAPWQPAGGFESPRVGEADSFDRMAKARTAYDTCSTLSHWPSKNEVERAVFGALVTH